MYLTIHLKIVNMINFMLCGFFYHNLEIIITSKPEVHKGRCSLLPGDQTISDGLEGGS